MVHFSYNGGCGVHECTHIKAFKRRAGLGYRYLIRVIGSTLLFITAIPLRI